MRASVLVTGGLGTVGMPLVAELRTRGHRVHVIDTAHTAQDAYTRCDVANFRELSELFQRFSFDYVYHLAAEFGRWNGEAHYEKVWLTNAIGTRHVLELQKAHGFRLVFFSSSEVYGDYAGVMSEDVPDRVPIHLLNDYALSKWVNEIQIKNAMARHNLQTVRVRLFNVYGPGEHYHPYRSAICTMAYRALHDIPYTVYRKHQRTHCYISDAVRSLANIVDRFQSGTVYNIGSNIVHDMKQASDLILKALGKCDQQLVTYRDTEPFTTRMKRVDISRAVRDLDHQLHVPLEEGIARTVKWLQNVYAVSP